MITVLLDAHCILHIGAPLGQAFSVLTATIILLDCRQSAFLDLYAIKVPFTSVSPTPGSSFPAARTRLIPFLYICDVSSD
jgi:hypothetical protein